VTTLYSGSHFHVLVLDGVFISPLWFLPSDPVDGDFIHRKEKGFGGALPSDNDSSSALQTATLRSTKGKEN
jgi:hypothetical protein